jgi:dual specificity phosphatase 12
MSDLHLSIMAAKSTRSLTENRITHILSVCADQIPAETPDAPFTHMRISVEDVDYADLLIHLPSACRFIDSALRSGGIVLVHCGQGLSRSAAVVAAYCMSMHFFFLKIDHLQSLSLVMWSHRVGVTQALEVVRGGNFNFIATIVLVSLFLTMISL